MTHPVHWKVAAPCALFCATFTGCFGCYPSYEIKFPVGHVPDKVENFRGLNSRYDDFNAAAPPTLTGSDWLALSTNRHAPAAGNRIELFMLNFSFAMTNGVFSGSAYDEGKLPLHHEGPEFGPLFVWPDRPPHRSTRLPAGVKPNHSYGTPVALLFAGKGPSGDLDLFVTEPFVPEQAGHDRREVAVRPIARVNRAGDQAYATFGPDGRMYLASNHDGQFDIYAVKGGPEPGASGEVWLDWLVDPSAPAAELEPVAALDSPGDDTAPSILDNAMVLTSNRSGSIGGFDLYFSTYSAATGWSTPVAIPGANSPSNDFRPTLMSLGAADVGGTMGLDPRQRPPFDNQLLLFSSDRPGGLGGYDMYYLGVVAPGVDPAPPAAAPQGSASGAPERH